MDENDVFIITKNEDRYYATSNIFEDGSAPKMINSKRDGWFTWGKNANNRLKLNKADEDPSIVVQTDRRPSLFVTFFLVFRTIKPLCLTSVLTLFLKTRIYVLKIIKLAKYTN